jgi:hypothetical protein
MSNDNLYFAAKEAKDCANILLNRGNSFYQNMTANAYLDKITRMWKAYHGAYNDSVGYGHQIEFTGEQGELVQLPVNHFRNLGRITYNMVTASRPVMQTRSINTDSKSLSQTYLANGILEYYMREKHLEYHLKKATEMAIVLGSGFIKMEWNSTAGSAYDIDPDTGEINYEGDIVFTNLSPLDVIVDGTKESWENEWIMVRSFQNRFNLIAKYPELKDRILGIDTKNGSSIYRLTAFSNDETDDIPVYEFFHKKTEALPDGRYILFASDDCIFLDTPLPYPDIPVYRIVPSEILGTPYGYTDMYDVFPIQEMINSCYSTIATNINAFGVQNVYVDKNSDLTVASIEGGLNLMEGNSPPQAINLTQTPAEVFKYLEVLIQSAETISGINSVARGNPEASLKSGAALALVQSMALQYVSGLQQSYVKLIEDVGTSMIKFLQIFAQTPRVAAIVGKNNRSYLKDFSADDLDKVNRVYVDMGNALSQTTAGRVQMAQELLQMGAIRNPDQYLQVINTGRLESALEGVEHQLILIKSENEKMMDGINPLVAPTDRHKQHILEHSDVLSDPDLREDPGLTKIVMDHIEMHMNALYNTNPDLLSMVGEVALAPQGQLMGPPSDQQGQPGPQQPGAGQVMAPDQGLPQGGEQISGPGIEQGVNMPNIPSPPAPFSDLPTDPSQMPVR